jgi:hypothetical protein
VGVTCGLIGALSLMGITSAGADKHGHGQHGGGDSNSSTITPTLTCVADSGSKGYTAYFGYTNSGPATEIAGDHNKVSPGDYNGTQPTSFASGSVTNAFSIVVDHGSVTWDVAGQSIRADAHSAACAGSTLPVDPYGGSLLLLVGAGGVAGVLYVRRIARRGSTL